jgi:F0F1-type ATP synthase membrane subunit b/b'
VVFLGKKLFKLALLLIFILLIICGYYYYKAPEEFPQKVETAIGETRDKAEEIVGKGKKILNNLDRIMEEKKENTSKE